MLSWTGISCLRFSPPTSGLARRRQWRGRGAQLEGGVAFNASGPQLRAWPRGGSGGVLSWTGSLLSTALAANFGPGPEGCLRGAQLGGELALSWAGDVRLWQPTSGLAGLARRRRRRGGLRDGECTLHCLSESPTGTVSGLARRRRRRGIWTKELHPCASRRRLRADDGLAGRTAAAAGSGRSCWRSQECSAPSPSRVLCFRLCLQADPWRRRGRNKHGKKWPYTPRFSSAGRPGGSGR